MEVVVFNKARSTWNFLWVENGKRKSRKLGSLAELASKAEALKRVEAVRREMRLAPEPDVQSIRQLVEMFRAEKMPQRASTKRGYDAWLDNHILPKWGEVPMTEVQARPVELWLNSLPLAPKSKLHIRGLFRMLWDYAMWRGDVPTQRNPMELVTIKGVSKRVRKPKSLTTEQFQSLLAQFKNDVCLRTFLLLAVSFGLRVSEVLGLKWKDIDWLKKTIAIERGVVKQILTTLSPSALPAR